MIRIISAIFISIALFGLSACSNTTMSNAAAIANERAIQEGSPYRWEYTREGEFDKLSKQLIGVPAPTSADQALEVFTKSQISSIENEQKIDATIAPNEVRLVSSSANHVEEIWVYKFGKLMQAFVVRYSPSDSGGTDIDITGPW